MAAPDAMLNEASARARLLCCFALVVGALSRSDGSSSWIETVSRASFPCRSSPLTPWCDKELLKKFEDAFEARTEKLKLLSKREQKVWEVQTQIQNFRRVVNATNSFIATCEYDRGNVSGLKQMAELVSLSAMTSKKLYVQQSVERRQLLRRIKTYKQDITILRTLRRIGTNLKVRKLIKKINQTEYELKESESNTKLEEKHFWKARARARQAEEKFRTVQREIRRNAHECSEARKANAKAKANIDLFEAKRKRIVGSPLLHPKVLMPTSVSNMAGVQQVLEKVRGLPKEAKKLMRKEIEVARDAAADALRASAKARAATREAKAEKEHLDVMQSIGPVATVTGPPKSARTKARIAKKAAELAAAYT